MKTIEFKVSDSLSHLFFPKKRVKTKIQVIEILLEATRYMLTTYNGSKGLSNYTNGMLLHIDKMSRLFFFSEKKYYSITFPFYLSVNHDEIVFSYKNELQIDSQLISSLISVIKAGVFDFESSIDFADAICNYEENVNDKFWKLLRDLFLYEDGYIRYDIDPDNFYTAKEKGDILKHPMYHYDLFYSSNASIKIGLNKHVSSENFIDLMNINTACKFIEN